jgi:hypothetical protein
MTKKELIAKLMNTIIPDDADVGVQTYNGYDKDICGFIIKEKDEIKEGQFQVVILIER